MPEDIREANIAAIPDPRARAARRSVIEHGIKAPEFAGALAAMIEMLDRAESTLARQPWLSGNSFGLADAAVIPYALRLDHLAMTPLLTADVRPALADWYARCRARPSFQSAVSKWAPAEVVELMRSQAAAEWPDVEPLTRNPSAR
jgi:glutathione S-transferase